MRLAAAYIQQLLHANTTPAPASIAVHILTNIAEVRNGGGIDDDGVYSWCKFAHGSRGDMCCHHQLPARLRVAVNVGACQE